MRSTAFLPASLALLSTFGTAAPADQPAGQIPGLDEIIVTGSHIRGEVAAGSRLIVIDRDQIDASGRGRIADVLATVTQNFSRSNPAVGSGDEVDNLNRGSEVQLRGLGLGTTLTLVNGQRQGASGFQGSFTDVSSIPASAVERIEILPEGAAALYGSDAIGGVVNIILRKNLDGFETRLRASSASGDVNGQTVAQLWGRTWPTGHVLTGAEADHSKALACAARAYCATNGDFRRWGGTDLRSVGGNPGTLLDTLTGAPLAAIPDGQDGTHLTAAQLIPGATNYSDRVRDDDILPRQKMWSVFLSGAQHIADSWELSLDAQYSSRSFESTLPQAGRNVLIPATNAFNRFGAPVLVGYDFTADIGPIRDSGPTETLGVAAALEGDLPHGWQLGFSTGFSKARTVFTEVNRLDDDAYLPGLDDPDPATGLNLFGDGSFSNPATLADLRAQTTAYRGANQFTTSSVSLVADGPLLAVPAGEIRLAVGGDFRTEHSVGLNIADGPEDRGRHAVAGFFELALPVLGSRPGAASDRLDVSLAGRYERYNDVGDTFNPKAGVSWRPSPFVTLRGNWGTSFRAPPFFWTNPDQMRDSAIAEVDDPRSPTGRALALQLFGPTPGMKPETAESWMVGVDVAPPEAQDYSLSLSYFEIDYRGKIRNPGPFAAVFLTREDEFTSLITRNPTRAQIDAVCENPLYGGDCNQPIEVILDNRFRNLSTTRTRGIDVAFDSVVARASGQWKFGLAGTYTIDLKQRITAHSPVFDVVDTVGYPLQLRVAGHASWSAKGWTTQTTLNYCGKYRDPGSLPERDVAAWTTVDLDVGYRVSGRGRLAGMRLDFALVNLFDRRAPFVNQFDSETGNLGYDAANASVLGREVSLQIVKAWGH